MLVAFAVGFFGKKLLAVESGDVDAVALYGDDSKKERAVYYIGSSGCVHCSNPALPEMVASIIDDLKDEPQGGVVVSSIGVAIDYNVEGGLSHLGDVYNFDQVSSGGNWFNHSGLPLMWNGSSQNAGTPQIVILERSINQDNVGVNYGESVELARAMGLEEIREMSGPNGIAGKLR